MLYKYWRVDMTELNESQVNNDLQYMVETLIEMDRLMKEFHVRVKDVEQVAFLIALEKNVQQLAIKITSIIGEITKGREQ
jgi:hypothetical protein